MLTRTYDIDVVPGGIPVKIHLSQYDSDVTLVFKLYASNGVLDVPSQNVTAKIRGTKNDRNGISADADFSIVDGVPTVTVQVTKQMTAIAGDNVYELVLTATGGNNTYDLPTANFYFVVERTALDIDTVESASQIQEIQDIMDRADDIIEAAQISAETQSNLTALTTRAENAAVAAEAAEDNASDAADDAEAARDAAQQAVSGFADAVTAARTSAVADVNSAGSTQIAAIEAAGEDVSDDVADIVSAATQAITQAKNTAVAEVTSTGEDAVDDVEDAATTAMTSINAKQQEIAAIRTDADTAAALATQTANQALNEVEGFEGSMTTLEQTVTTLEAQLGIKVDGAFVENGYLYMTSGGVVVIGPLGPFSSGGGGGGGSSDNNATISLTNTTGWLSRTQASGASCELTFTWSSLENEIPTGNGTVTITNNGMVILMRDIAQGAATIDVGDYLTTGSNALRVSVSDVYGNTRNINYTVSVVLIGLSSTFDDSQAYTGPISFPFTPVGAVSKTMHFILDGTEIGTMTTSVSNRQQTYVLTQQTHGAHTLEVYFDATINGTTVTSNHLYYEIIWLQEFNTDPIIASSFNSTSITQYTTVNIPFTVYDPTSQVADVTITVNGTVAAQLADVDRTSHVFTYRIDTIGTVPVVITSGAASKTITLTVTQADIEIEAVTENLALHLSSAGRSNNEVSPGTWVDGDVSCTFTDFNFVSDGWIRDSDGLIALKVSGDARLTIPYQPFAQDFRSTGKTIEIEFATDSVMNYDAVILSCLSGGRGLNLTAQSCSLTSEQSAISMQFKENEHIRVGFVVEKRSENHLIYCYINGIPSGTIQYPDGDDFSQPDPVDITVGNNNCAILLYSIRVYDNDLSRQQMLENWIADTQDISLLLSRYSHNDVYDEYGNIVIEKLPTDLPYLIIECAELPQYKGDKKTVTGSYTDPLSPSRSFTYTGAQCDVQGTSSQYYERKNYKIKFKNGFVFSSGAASTFQLTDDCVPTSTFCFKADVASSEGANNVELVRLYCEACPYQTPAQVENPLVRQGIDGFPIVIFWRNTSTNDVTFLGKYNFNLDKGTEENYGFVEGDESWEIRNNTGNRVIWKSDDYTSMFTDEDNNTYPDWLNDFEARFPDTDPAYTDPSQLQEFATWIKSTDTTAATDEDLAEAVTYDGVEYTTDSASYRLAKFRAELSDYAELQSALFYYLFTEAFLMVDSRAKNAFPSFIGTSLVEEDAEEGGNE